MLPDGRVVISQAYGPLRLLSDSLSRLSTLPGPADLACGGLCLLRGGGFLASDSRRHVVPPPSPRTKWTRRVPHPVLIGHAASLTPY